MATLYAQASGNWSAIIWNTAANGSGTNQVPASADTLHSNGFTVTIDGDKTVYQITNTGGGTFALSQAATLTCTHPTAGIFCTVSGIAVTASIASNVTATIVSNISAAYGIANSSVVKMTGSGSLDIVGNLNNGSTGNAVIMVTNSGSGSVMITGQINGGNTGTNSAIGALNSGSGSMRITGTLTGGAGNGAANYGAQNSGAGTLTVVGSCIGGGVGAASNHAIFASSGITNIHGPLYASASCAAVSGLAQASIVLSGPLVPTNTGEAGGMLPIVAPRWFIAPSAIPTFSYPIASADLVNNVRTLLNLTYQPPAYPLPADVRAGVAYGALTGTCAVPPAAGVAAGVPIDATTGTAVLTAADVATAVRDLMSTDLARVAHCSTVESTGAQLAAALSPT